jgi:hypothetical protein
MHAEHADNAVQRPCATRLLSRRGLPKLQMIGASHSILGTSARGHVRVVECFDGLQLDHCYLHR